MQKLGEDIDFTAMYRTAKVGTTGLAVTVTIYAPDGSVLASAEACTEVGSGLYRRILPGASVTQAGEYKAVFHTAATTVDCQDVACAEAVGLGGVGYLDASVAAVPAGILDVQTSLHTVPGSVGEAISNAGLASDPWAATLATLNSYADHTAARLWVKLDVGAMNAPVIVVPAPPSTVSECTVYLYTRALDSAVRPYAFIEFRLSALPAENDGRGIESKSVRFVTDADGLLQGTLQRTDTLLPAGRTYIVNSEDFGLVDVPLELEADTYDLIALFQ